MIMTSYYIGMKSDKQVWLVCVPYREKFAGPSVYYSTVLAQSLQNVFHVQIVGQSVLNCPIWLSYNLKNITDFSPRICKNRLTWTFAMVSGVLLVDGCLKCSSSSTDVRPSLKHCTTKWFYFGLWDYLHRLPLEYDVLQQIFKLEIKFDAVSVLIKIHHISLKENRRITQI